MGDVPILSGIFRVKPSNIKRYSTIPDSPQNPYIYIPQSGMWNNFRT